MAKIFRLAVDNHVRSRYSITEEICRLGQKSSREHIGMEIKRDLYLNRLINRKNNGLIKIVTGIRRCGKSYLLDPLFKNHLLNEGVPQDHIIKIELDRISNRGFHKDPEAFNRHIHSLIKDNGQYYLLLDEIQLVEDFELVLNGLLRSEEHTSELQSR